MTWRETHIEVLGGGKRKMYQLPLPILGDGYLCSIEVRATRIDERLLRAIVSSATAQQLDWAIDYATSDRA